MATSTKADARNTKETLRMSTDQLKADSQTAQNISIYTSTEIWVRIGVDKQAEMRLGRCADLCRGSSAQAVGLRAVAVTDKNGSRRDWYRPVRCGMGTCFLTDGALGMNQRLTGSQTLASCDYWLPWEFLYPSTAVTGLTDGSRQSAAPGARSDGQVDQAVAKKRPSFNRPSDGTDGPEPYRQTHGTQ
ncbi:hypothetical protein C8F04DRAFT_1195182 [Mycena alexandri]|uniref:Uncharacterized protein n=1 Tax=Mycena alexandri TaxID=1745969 RepID=A0AAD6WSA4_9AGAR|nr:hypothetical protein C8F04DRAFT_1195182 [Mycena alexandri]